MYNKTTIIHSQLLIFFLFKNFVTKIGSPPLGIQPIAIKEKNTFLIYGSWLEGAGFFSIAPLITSS